MDDYKYMKLEQFMGKLIVVIGTMNGRDFFYFILFFFKQWWKLNHKDRTIKRKTPQV